MVFRTISSALMAGFLAGLCLFLIQRSSTLPLIHAAETYEKPHNIESASDQFATEPVRSLTTLLGDIFVASAFGLILTGVYAISCRDGLLNGLLCGLVIDPTLPARSESDVPTIPGRLLDALEDAGGAVFSDEARAKGGDATAQARLIQAAMKPQILAVRY